MSRVFQRCDSLDDEEEGDDEEQKEENFHGLPFQHQTSRESARSAQHGKDQKLPPKQFEG